MFKLTLAGTGVAVRGGNDDSASITRDDRSHTKVASVARGGDKRGEQGVVLRGTTSREDVSSSIIRSTLQRSSDCRVLDVKVR